MASRRPSSRRTQAHEEQGNDQVAPEPSARRAKSSRRAAVDTAQESPPKEGRSSGSRRGKTARQDSVGAGTSRTSRTDAGDKRSSGRMQAGSRRLSPAEEARKKKKIKGILTNMGIVAVLGVLVLIGISMMPNPNLEVAAKEIKKAEILLEGMEKDLESGSLGSIVANHEEIKAILGVPMFAMGTGDEKYYEDEHFADYDYSIEAKTLMKDAAKVIERLPDVLNRKKALRLVFALKTRLESIGAEESLELLSADITAYQSNPTDPEIPDALMEAKYKSYMHEITGFEKIIAEEQGKRSKLSAEKQAVALKLAQEQKVKDAAEKVAKRKASLEEARGKNKAEQDAARDPVVVAAEAAAKKEAEKFEAMTNSSILKECIVAIDEYKYNLAIQGSENFKEEAGNDPAVQKAKVLELIDKNFDEMQREVAQLRNDARMLHGQNQIQPARDAINEAVLILDMVVANTKNMKEKEKIAKELLEMALAMQRKVGGG